MQNTFGFIVVLMLLTQCGQNGPSDFNGPSYPAQYRGGQSMNFSLDDGSQVENAIGSEMQPDNEQFDSKYSTLSDGKVTLCDLGY